MESFVFRRVSVSGTLRIQNNVYEENLIEIYNFQSGLSKWQVYPPGFFWR